MTPPPARERDRRMTVIGRGYAMGLAGLLVSQVPWSQPWMGAAYFWAGAVMVTLACAATALEVYRRRLER